MSVQHCQAQPSASPMCVCVWLSHSVLSDSVAPWTAACQAPLSMEFSRQEYSSGLPFPTLRDPPDPGIELLSLASPSSPALVSIVFTTSATWVARNYM